MDPRTEAPTDPRPLSALVHRLEQRLVEVEALQHDLIADARAPAEVISAETTPRPAPSVLSVKQAAAELGISESMLHQLLKQRRLGDLKVGARTLITPEQLARFRHDASVAVPVAVPVAAP